MAHMLVARCPNRMDWKVEEAQRVINHHADTRSALHVALRSALLGFQGLPKGSYAVLFWVRYSFLVGDYDLLPQKGTTLEVLGGCFHGKP